MNYRRVYAAFIRDRQEREPTITGYFEKHHIVPRCMGGGDESSNIVRLTPEDHFFAHLLLAKAHGGKLWAPVAFMLGGSRKDYQPIVSRTCYGWAARAMARAASGEAAHQFDRTVYRLEHREGRKWSGRQSDMPGMGIEKSLANMLIKGRVKSARGWFIEGQRPKFKGHDLTGTFHHNYRHEIRTFIHVDGRRFVGTQNEFGAAHGVGRPAASGLVKGKVLCAKGWYLEGTTALAKTGRGAKWKIPVAAQLRMDFSIL